jgi:hypothetical protein
MREPLQVNVVDPHHFSSMNVDDLTVQYILVKKKQIFVTAERLKKGVFAQLDGSSWGLHDVFHRHQPGSFTRFEQQAGYVPGGQPSRHRHVFESTLDAALPIRDRRSEQEREAGVAYVLFMHRRPVAV